MLYPAPRLHAAEDADAVVVTADVKRQRRNAGVTVGCAMITQRRSRIELDRPGSRRLLTCNFAAAG